MMTNTHYVDDHVALLVCDMQNGFLTHRCIPFINRVMKVMGVFAKQKHPIIVTQFINHPASPHYRLLNYRKMRHYPDIDILQEIKAYFPKRIVKSRYSALTDELKTYLAHWDIRTLYLCGVETDASILKTALDAFEYNLRVKIITDACFTHAIETLAESTFTILTRNIGHGCLVSMNQLSPNSL